MRLLIKTLFFLFLSSSAWAAYPNYTIKPSGGDYNNIEGAITDMSTNHATLSSPVTITISGDWTSFADTTAVNITGITTSSSNTITITAPPTTGVYNNAHYRLELTNATAFEIQESYVTVQNLQVKETDTLGFNSAMGISGSLTNVTLSGNILQQNSGSGLNDSALSITSGTITNYNIYNNVLYESGFNDSQQGGVYISATDVINFYNNTMVGFNDGIYSGGSPPFLDNNISQCTNYDFQNVTVDAANITIDASGNTGFKSTTLTFINKAGYNFALAAADTAAIATGYNLYSTFTTDITGATRQSVGDWDVGAFFYTTYVPPSITTINNAVLSNATIK